MKHIVILEHTQSKISLPSHPFSPGNKISPPQLKMINIYNKEAKPNRKPIEVNFQIGTIHPTSKRLITDSNSSIEVSIQSDIDSGSIQIVNREKMIHMISVNYRLCFVSHPNIKA